MSPRCRAADQDADQHQDAVEDLCRVLGVGDGARGETFEEARVEAWCESDEPRDHHQDERRTEGGELAAGTVLAVTVTGGAGDEFRGHVRVGDDAHNKQGEGDDEADDEPGAGAQ